MRTGCLLVVLIATIVACGAHPEPDATGSESAGRLVLREDGTAEVSGVVAENVHDCAVDLWCYLVVPTDRGAVHVVYHEGMGPPCPNTAVMDRAWALEPGDRVRAVGEYRGRGRAHLVTTCPSSDFVIERMDGPHLPDPASGPG